MVFRAYIGDDTLIFHVYKGGFRVNSVTSGFLVLSSTCIHIFSKDFGIPGERFFVWLCFLYLHHIDTSVIAGFWMPML